MPLAQCSKQQFSLLNISQDNITACEINSFMGKNFSTYMISDNSQLGNELKLWKDIHKH